MIRTNVTLTGTMPTIEIWDEARTPAAHRAVMAAAHMLAAKLWTTNIGSDRHLSARPINVEATCDAGARVTIETFGNTTAEREDVLGLMRAAIREMSGKQGRAFRPDGREIVVSIPER